MISVPRFHVVTDDHVLSDSGFLSRATEVLEEGGAAVCLHLRGPETGGHHLYDLALHLKTVAEEAGAHLIVNDRVDVAMAVGLNAIHLGRRSLSVSETRRLVPLSSIGASCHDAVEVSAAREADASWIILGNIFETASHPERPGLGLHALQEVVVLADYVPVIAIGGVTIERVPGVLASGAWGVAVMSGVWGAESPSRASSEYISMLQADTGET
ncbi:MAG: thiamine phosphate synthase [Gemmatimonadaceae bacterium]|nr:thiamine phosphate synthase [Gemmatimonadaceae bacterium]